MNVLQIILGLMQPIIFKVFPFFTYKSVINRQVKIYKKLKKKYPDVKENEILNYLLILRIEAPPRITSKEVEYDYYKEMLEKKDKTLEDVILEVIVFENIISRMQSVLIKFSKMGLTLDESKEEIEKFKIKVAEDIKESIEIKLVK